MPVEMKYIDNGLGFFLMGSDTVTGQELLKANALPVENFLKCKYWLWDLSQTDNFDILSTEMERLAMQDKNTSKSIPHMIGALVCSQDIMYGLSRMYEAYAILTGWETIVTRTREESEAWIKEKLNMDLTFS